MDKELLIKRFDNITDYLPKEIGRTLLKLDDNIKSSAEEIRLRAGRPLSLTVRGSQFFVYNVGTCMLPRKDCIRVTAYDLEQCFLNLCNHSVYSHNEELCEGYISLPEGHRAGICGRAVVRDGKIETLRDISSVNLRIAKEVPSFADRLIKEFDGGGILICGGPGTGKTTLLRDMARQLAAGVTGRCYKVAVIDSRGEIAAVSNGVPGSDIGSTADVITAVPKAKGIEMALRTLYPDVVIFDELGNDDEVAAAMQSFNSGVTVITTAHAGNMNDLLLRGQICRLLGSGAINKVALCHRGFKYTVHLVNELELPLKERVRL